ncbi:MAG: helix-turn-helix domain-containing protein [Opitutales bacterium]|nr:helix-turn-helix domain-containing protein [Opitutales bacterium]
MGFLPHSLFTTDVLPEKDRFAAWREDMSTIFDVEKSPLPVERPYHATFELHHFGQSVLGDLRASTGRYLRTQRKAARDGLDAVLLQLFIEGGVQFGVGRRTTYAEAGDIVIFDLAQPVDNINSKFRHVTSMWPRAAIEVVVPEIARWHGQTLPRDNPSVDLLRRHMLSCQELAPRFSISEGQRVESATLVLAGAAMASGELLPESEAQGAMMEVLTYQIKRYIRENLGASNLSPAQIARKFGISRTQLYQLLEPLGGIARYQRHLRLQRCLAALQDPVQAHLQIAEIAYRWGFNHPATFNRNFRKAFDITPGEARAEANGGIRPFAPALPPSFKQQQIQREHHQWFHAIGI